MSSTNHQPAYLEEDLIPATERRRASLGALLEFTRADRSAFVNALLLLVISAGATMATAITIGDLVENGLIKRDLYRSISPAALTLALEALAVYLAYRGRRGLAEATSRSILRIRESLFHHIHRLPLSYYDRQPLGRTVTRISHDVESLEVFFSGSLSRLLLSSLLIVMSLGAMLITDLRLGATLVVLAIPALIITGTTRFRARDLNRQMTRTNSAINARLAEYLNGIGVIRSFGLERWSAGEFRRSVQSYLTACISTNRFYSWLRPIAELLCQLPLVGLLWFGGHSVISGTLSLGIFVAFVRYCQRFSGPITELSREVQAIQEALSTCERVSLFLNSPTEEIELGPDGVAPASDLRGAIEFREVSMGYPGGEQILFDLSFSIPAGATVGFAGPTGSGKTTTVSLLARLYEFQRGEILIDSVPLRRFRRASLRDAIGFVSQDVVIIEGSIADNIANGRDCPREAIENAAHKTGLAGVLHRSGRGLDSAVLDRGANLSEGERQLIALTRVLVAAPAILILDEATAHIDPELEAIVHAAVDTVMRGRTSLIIAHRLATLKNCDTVLVFRAGRMIEQGPPREVLRHSVELPSEPLLDVPTAPPLGNAGAPPIEEGSPIPQDRIGGEES
ncbi:MAG: hypothetical protein RL417_678 [Pseudomonadota bacterium]|jgi:ABC-type multidrug transport system fused ATPase/permease subunit